MRFRAPLPYALAVATLYAIAEGDVPAFLIAFAIAYVVGLLAVIAYSSARRFRSRRRLTHVRRAVLSVGDVRMMNDVVGRKR